MVAWYLWRICKICKMVNDMYAYGIPGGLGLRFIRYFSFFCTNVNYSPLHRMDGIGYEADQALCSYKNGFWDIKRSKS